MFNFFLIKEKYLRGDQISRRKNNPFISDGYLLLITVRIEITYIYLLYVLRVAFFMYTIKFNSLYSSIYV